MNTTHHSTLGTAQLSRAIVLVLLDLLGVIVTSMIALLVRLEFSVYAAVNSGYLNSVCTALPLQLILTGLLLSMLGCYKSLWQYAGAQEFIRVIIACFASAGVTYLFMWLFRFPIPRSYPLLSGLFLTLWSSCARLSYRFLRRRKHRSTEVKKRTMLIGGGDAGTVILREFQQSIHSKNQVVCIIDDDANKHGCIIRTVPVVGGRSKIPEMAEKYGVEEIVLAVPSASAAQRREIITICQQTGCNVKTIPALYQLVSGEATLPKLRDIQVEDLLGRDSIRVDQNGITEFLTGKTVLVTGGGGSIGSELCRQIASASPACLIVFDIYENNAYDLQQELLRTYPGLNLKVLIGSVRDSDRLQQLFETYHPHLVYHAAAHKHVPLMEHSPAEAVKNNVFGTLNVARMADRYGVEKMVLISTDKAVNPTNIMGATKRICEMVTQIVGRNSKTDYVSVRFGNVLGSNGSVIPLFQKQIAQGGPVTVTDKRIIRYFMTIPEAVSLVLQAGVYAVNGEIFVLDMGEPVKIDDLARNMIRLSGYEPDVDIPIVYTGLRPGEKLYEELLLKNEGMRTTENDLIFIIKDEPFDDNTLLQQLDVLRAAAEDNQAQEVRNLIHQIVPEFHEPTPAV